MNKSTNESASDAEVEAQLNSRISYFIQLYGSKENLERISGKNIEQIKEENRGSIQEQVIASRQLQE